MGRTVNVPFKALNMKDYVKKGANKPGWFAQKGYKGGEKYLNDGRGGTHVLPRTTRDGKKIEYRSWDIDPYKKGQPRNAERIISGSDGSFWYTNDHYKSFINIGR